MVLSIRTVRTVTLKDGVVAPLAKKASRIDWACWKGPQQPFAARQGFTVDTRHKAPVCLRRIHFAGQVIAKEGIHQPVPGANMRADRPE